MKLNDAIRILVRHTERDCHGAGCGIRTSPTQEEREEIIQAIARVWYRLYGYQPTRSEVSRRL